MDESTTNKIEELLKSPNLLENVQSVLSQLTRSENDTSAIIPSDSQDLTKMLEIIGGQGALSSIGNMLSHNKSERLTFLAALRPFLSDEKQATLDAVLQILKLASLFIATQTLT